MKTKISNNQEGFAHLIIFLLVVAAIVGTAGYFVFSKSVDKKASNPFRSIEKSTACSDADRVTLTHSPMNIEDVATVTPYGLTAGAHITPIDHLYFYPKEGPRDKYPVFAMADGEITSITVRGVNVGTGESRPLEYRYEFKHSCQTFTYFDLVTKLDQSILDVAPKAATEGFSGSIKVKAGQEIGRIGAQSLDTAVYNSTLILPGFIHPEMYKAEPWKVHTDDFFSYFNEPLKSQMLALNSRTVEPRSGKIDYDQAGKLIGNWFLEGTNGYAGPTDLQNKAGSGDGSGYWSGHLAIFYDAINPSTIIISFGKFRDQGPHSFAVKGNAPDPATINKASGVVKYVLIQPNNSLAPTHGVAGPEKIEGVVLFQVLDGEKLKVEAFPDKPADEVSAFTSSAQIYER